ncbi:integrase catalytic domain-containing protein [Trichonephila clavipes]|nr:integrase catalytic domain-containing protein [Trichonephila clavipes]
MSNCLGIKKDKITEFTPSSSLDISNVEIPKFLTLADKSFYEANEVHALISADVFFKVLKQNTYKVNEELFFKESEFGWIACGKLEERQINKQGQCFLVNNDSIQDTLKLFFDLEGLGIRDDPVLHERDQAIEIFKETVEFEKGRYIVQLPFRKSYNELSDNYPLAKQRFQNLWRRFGEVKTEFTDNKLKRPVYYLPHQAVRKDSRLTSKTRIVFDAGSHQNNELSLNDCLWPEINLNPNLLDILINFRLNAIAFCSDIKQAFLQICLADEHKDAVRFLWSDDEPCVHKRLKLQVYRFNRVNFGVSSSPFLLATTIRHHIEKYKHEIPHTVELLDRNFYVDDLISGGNELEEALQTSRRAKNIMEAAGMDLRKWITNDADLMEQWKKENFNVHPVHETVSLGANGTKISGKKKFNGTTLCQHILKRSGKKWCEELPHLRNLKIPRLVLDSTLLEDDVELHSFCDASKKAYDAAIYLRTKSRNGISVKLVTSKSRVAPLNCVTLPRLKLLGALVAARLASKVKKIVNLKRSCLQYHWTDSKIVLFWIKGNKTRCKQFVANRVNEISSLTDPHSWYHCAGKENPADFLSRGLSADCLQVVPELDYLTEHEKETVVQERKKLPEADRSEETVLLNSDSSSILDELLELSNNYFKVINILSYIFRFNYNCWNKSKKVGPLTVAEFKESVIKLIKYAQRSLFDKKETPSCISNLFPFVDGEGIVRVGGRLENASVPYLHKHPAILPKAIHLELLSDLTSDALIATLKRFTSRRGKCSKIYTDNATNFVRANSILKKFHKLINFPDENLAKYFVSENIEWKFLPPKSPHFGGLWEAGVKSVKHHLKRAIGNLHFTFEEFETIMIQVEGILNSRPLTPLSSDADNFDVLTPGHFLIGRPITSISEPNLIDVNENRLSRWEKITKVEQRTWKK